MSLFFKSDLFFTHAMAFLAMGGNLVVSTRDTATAVE
jgi:hypothetical protein